MIRIFSALLLAVAFFASAAPEAPPYSCAYWNKKDDAVETLDTCAKKQDGKLVFLPELFSKSAEVDGMYWVGLYDYAKEAGVPDVDYYVRSADNYLSVINFDNGPDWFVEGLVRSRQNGKIGYWDYSFQNRIAPQYDFAGQFKDGKALVCIGCTAQREGEHITLVGGEWYYINTDGKRVSDIKSAPF